MKTNPYDGPERRQYFRYTLICSPKEKARLSVGENIFDVIDFSDGGLRFVNPQRIPLENPLHGELILADGQTKTVCAEIVWKTQKEIGLRFT